MKAQRWHHEFIQSLEEAADIGRQRRSWVERKDWMFPTRVELICQLFDDSGVSDLLETGAVIFSDAADVVLRRLSVLADRVNLAGDPEVLLSSEEWGEFVAEAARLLVLVREALS